MSVTDNVVRERILGLERGAIFFPSDFDEKNLSRQRTKHTNLVNNDRRDRPCQWEIPLNAFTF